MFFRRGRRSRAVSVSFRSPWSSSSCPFTGARCLFRSLFTPCISINLSSAFFFSRSSLVLAAPECFSCSRYNLLIVEATRGMLAPTPSCLSLCEFLSTGESLSRFCFWVFFGFHFWSTVPEKYTVTSAQSSACARKVDYNRMSSGSLRRSLEAPHIFFYPDTFHPSARCISTLAWVDHIP